MKTHYDTIVVRIFKLEQLDIAHTDVQVSAVVTVYTLCHEFSCADDHQQYLSGIPQMNPELT